VNSVDRFGRSPLYDAIINRNKPIAFELKNAGANILANHQELTTKLLRAAKDGDLEFIKLFYFAGLKNLHDYFNMDHRNIAHIVILFVFYSI
jgi:lysophospholipase